VASEGLSPQDLRREAKRRPNGRLNSYGASFPRRLDGNPETIAVTRKWIEAGGAYQLPCMKAAGRVLKGEQVVLCPKCRDANLRYYFHAFDKSRGEGTIWVWCPSCHLTCRLRRVSPMGPRQQDPFAVLDLDQFANLELTPGEPLLDRLDRLWDEGILR
jgi:hypothetical protein